MLGFLGAIASAALVIVWLISIITIIKDARRIMTAFTIKALIDLYRQCEKDKLQYSDEPPTLEYFVNWLEGEGH